MTCQHPGCTDPPLVEIRNPDQPTPIRVCETHRDQTWADAITATKRGGNARAALIHGHDPPAHPNAPTLF